MFGRFAAEPTGDEYSSSLKAAGITEIHLIGGRHTAKVNALKVIAAVRPDAPAAALDAPIQP